MGTASWDHIAPSLHLLPATITKATFKLFVLTFKTNLFPYALSPVQRDQLKAAYPKPKGLIPISVRSSPARLQGRGNGTEQGEFSQEGPFLTQHLGQLEPPLSTPSLRPPPPWRCPISFQPLPLLLGTSGLSCLRFPPALLHILSLVLL